MNTAENRVPPSSEYGRFDGVVRMLEPYLAGDTRVIPRKFKRGQEDVELQGHDDRFVRTLSGKVQQIKRMQEKNRRGFGAAVAELCGFLHGAKYYHPYAVSRVAQVISTEINKKSSKPLSDEQRKRLMFLKQCGSAVLSHVRQVKSSDMAKQGGTGGTSHCHQKRPLPVLPIRKKDGVHRAGFHILHQ